MRLYLASVTDNRLWGGGDEIISCWFDAFISLQWQQYYTWQRHADRSSTHTHTHTQEMKLYLACENGVKNGLQRGEEGWQDLSVLESFYYARKNPFFERLYYKGVDLLLDSGAFTFMSSGKRVDWDEYVEEYAAFINKYQIEKFFELDIDSIVGMQEVERLREKLETLTGRKCIPVWHKSRGIDYWKRMCSEYDYVGIGGLTKVATQKVTTNELRSLVIMANKIGTKVHALGFTPCDILSENIPMYSSDSTTWIVGNRTGIIYKFDGRKICKYNVPKGKRLKAADAARHNFLEWVKYQKYLRKYES